VAAEVSTADTLRRVRANADAASDRRKVVGGAAIGAVLGQVLGKDTKGTVIGAAAGGAVGAATAARGARFEGCLPEGSKITLRLTDAIVRS
jgi:outer membrane lipoprotein SlyB